MPTDLATQQLLEQQRIAQQLLENDTKGNRRYVVVVTNACIEH